MVPRQSVRLRVVVVRFASENQHLSPPIVHDTRLPVGSALLTASVKHISGQITKLKAVSVDYPLILGNLSL